MTPNYSTNDEFNQPRTVDVPPPIPQVYEVPASVSYPNAPPPPYYSPPTQPYGQPQYVPQPQPQMVMMVQQPTMVNKLPNPDDDVLVPDNVNIVEDAKSNYSCLSTLYFLLILSIWIVEILVHCNTPAYIFSLSNCDRNSPYLAKLPLFNDYRGNSSDSDFYFADWHFTPNKGFCPSVPMPDINKATPRFNAPKRRQLSLIEEKEGMTDGMETSPSLMFSQEDGGQVMKDRDLRASGGGGGGHGGSSSGGGGSSRSGSTSSSGSSYSYRGGTRVYYYGANGYNSRAGGAAAVQYFGCVTFGQSSGSRTHDQNSINIWANIDSANANAKYNAGLGYGSVTSSFAQGANGMLKVDAIMLFGTIVAGVGYPLVTCFMFMNGDVTMLYMEQVVQFATSAIALAVILYLPNNEMISMNDYSAWQKTIFPTCTVTISDGPLFTMYLYLVIITGILFLFFIVAELHFHFCENHLRAKRPEERSDYVAPATLPPAAPGKCKPFCKNCSTKLVFLNVDPYLSINQFGICDGCNAERFYSRDHKGYHCPRCPLNNSNDLCYNCYDEGYEMRNGMLPIPQMVQVPVSDVYVYTPPPQPTRAMTTIAHHNRERAKALLFHTGVSKRNLTGSAPPAGDELNASVHEGGNPI